MRKPTVPEVLPLVKQYYSRPMNGTGGNLHIVLEDGNVEDHDVEFCKKQCLERNDEEGIVIVELLLKMSKTQRKKIYAQSCA